MDKLIDWLKCHLLQRHPYKVVEWINGGIVIECRRCATRRFDATCYTLHNGETT